MPQSVLSQQWRPVRGGIPFGISGMTLLEQQSNFRSFLVVHDNKDKSLGRLAIITIKSEQSPKYFPINWSSDTPLPIDLESLTAVPGTSEPTFMTATSAGKVYHFRLSASQQNISILKVFDFPNIPKESNFEGFALQKINGQLLAVWAHRGQDRDPAVLYWGKLDLNTYQITQIGSTQLKVPWPVSAVRHVSDVKVDPAGVLFISSAADNGDDGPFESAVYVAGAFGISQQQITFQQNFQLVPLYRFNYHKVEAIELVPGQTGGVIFGSDDENMGGSVYLKVLSAEF
ncbi:MAG TPA: hypothetical protein DCE56_11970 [Cyanobacteria bacterium UBA8553]|nr:hypothetical protein [Cyanobacteria bacterium UBA8553]HAJ57964.1 hypothetical protein [Cyanobacteria bacterium UBA8543]